MKAEHDSQEQLVLKAEWGAPLTPQEAEALEKFLSTPQGRAYLDGVRATKKLIRQEGSVIPEEVIDQEQSTYLREKFEATLRARAQTTRSQFRGLLLVSFGAAAAFSLFFGHILPRFHPKQPGPGDVLSLWIVLLGAATLFCLYMLYRLHELQHAPDLFDRLTARERRVPRTIAAQLRRMPTMLFLIYLLSLEEGWGKALVVVPTMWVLFALAAHYLRRTLRRERMGEDRELWSWWYGELDGERESGPSRTS